MSKTKMNISKQREIIAKSAGRCEFEGCGEYLLVDSITHKPINVSEMAHIIADSENGPRGLKLLSTKFSNDVSNIMLLCKNHHHLIDNKPEEYTVDLLREMKKNHEGLVEKAVTINNRKESTKVVIYKANIGRKKDILVDEDDVYESIENYYVDSEYINLSIMNSNTIDSNQSFWEFNFIELENSFKNYISDNSIVNKKHISLFALAPQPLLIKLGNLLTDISNVDIYQKFRYPSTWKWQSKEPAKFTIREPQEKYDKIALIINISGEVDENLVYEAIGSEEISIWKIEIDKPALDSVKSLETLTEFKKTITKVYEDIKIYHGVKNVINLFPATPNSIAVEIGRSKLNKAHLPIVIYDNVENNFVKTGII